MARTIAMAGRPRPVSAVTSVAVAQAGIWDFHLTGMAGPKVGGPRPPVSRDGAGRGAM